MTSRRYRRRRKIAHTNELLFVAVAALLGLVFVNYQLLEALHIATMALFGAAGLIAVGLFLAIRYKLNQRQKALKALEMAQIDTMKGRDFEHYIGEVLKSQGYKTKVTRESGDFGVDIIAQKDGARTAVQVRRYKGKVDLKAFSKRLPARL